MTTKPFLISQAVRRGTGQVQTTAIECDVIERLRKAYGDLIDGRSSE